MERKNIGKAKAKTPAKKTTTTPRRKKRVSGVNMSGELMQAATVLIGAVGARVVGNVFAKQFPGIDNKIINAGQAAAGFFLPKFVKQPWAKNVGLGMIATGGLMLAVNMGVISGTGDRIAYNIRKRNEQMSGLSDLHTISGANLSNLQSVGSYKRVAGVNNATGQPVHRAISRYFKAA